MDELFRILPDEYVSPIKNKLLADKLCEVRIANGAPVRVCYDGAYKFLCGHGLTDNKSEAFVARKNEADSIIMRACERSLYTVTDTIRRGYIPVRGGIRIGVCGSGVTSGGDVAAVKDFCSVNIRLPHEVKGCAEQLFARAVANGTVKNTLIISPPGMGKTTVLRDLCRLVSERGHNVLLCDEKFELAAAVRGVPTLDVGCRTDVMSGMSKAHVLSVGIASMRPHVVMADELFGGELAAVEYAASCGVSVVATVHAQNADELRRKPDWARAVGSGLFAVHAVLTALPRRNMVVYEGGL